MKTAPGFGSSRAATGFARKREPRRKRCAARNFQHRRHREVMRWAKLTLAWETARSRRIQASPRRSRMAWIFSIAHTASSSPNSPRRFPRLSADYRRRALKPRKRPRIRATPFASHHKLARLRPLLRSPGDLVSGRERLRSIFTGGGERTAERRWSVFRCRDELASWPRHPRQLFRPRGERWRSTKYRSPVPRRGSELASRGGRAKRSRLGPLRRGSGVRSGWPGHRLFCRSGKSWAWAIV